MLCFHVFIHLNTKTSFGKTKKALYVFVFIIMQCNVFYVIQFCKFIIRYYTAKANAKGYSWTAQLVSFILFACSCMVCIYKEEVKKGDLIRVQFVYRQFYFLFIISSFYSNIITIYFQFLSDKNIWFFLFI